MKGKKLKELEEIISFQEEEIKDLRFKLFEATGECHDKDLKLEFKKIQKEKIEREVKAKKAMKDFHEYIKKF